MKNTHYLILLVICSNVFGQIKGNSTISRQNVIYAETLSNSKINSLEIDNFRNTELIPNSLISIDVKVLNNVIADSYTAVFNLSQIGKTSEETNTLMNNRLAKLKSELLKIGVIQQEVITDVISFIPIYETVVEQKLFSKKYVEIPKGFKLQKNIHIKFTKINQFDGILSACANNEIYNLVKVDYFINNIEMVYRNLRIQILKTLKEKKQFYSDLGFDLNAYTPIIADKKYCLFPKEFYKSYQSYNSISIEALKKQRGISTAKKETAYFYDPLSFKDYDYVINPSIVEPVIQIGMEIKLQYSPKSKAPKPNEKQIIKNKYFIISDNGKIAMKELKLEN